MGVRVVFPDMGKDPSVQLIEKTITQNGTYDAITDGANGYSKVNVNVEGGGGGESDFSTAVVTVTGTQASSKSSYLKFVVIRDNNLDIFDTYSDEFGDSNPVILTVVLYNGEQKISGAWNDVLTQASGNCEVDYDTGVLTVKGDCALTVVPQLLDYPS